MKICWDNLEDLRYSKKTGKWYKKTYTFIYENSCLICNEPFLRQSSVKSFLCSKGCMGLYKRDNLKGLKINKLIILYDTGKRNKCGHVIWKCLCECGKKTEVDSHSLKCGNTKSCGCYNIKCALNRKGKNNPNWDGGYNSNDIPKYNLYYNKLIEEVRRNPEDENILQVRCKKCNNWFTPKLFEIRNRVQYLKGNSFKESHLYCSPECKQSCSIFGKSEKTYLRENSPYYEEQDNYRPYQTEWSKMVIEKDNYTCQICESKKNLVAHHIKPVKTHQHLQADVDNGICLCEKCHNKHGHKDECSTGNLAKKVC